MTQIKKILDKQGNEVFIRTSTKAVVDGNGYTAESRLQAMQDEINQAQLEIGAVPSDLTPTENSTNWVTSGGLYNQLNVGDANVEIDLTEYTAVRAFPNPNNWLVTSDNYPYYGMFIPIVPNQRYRIKGNSNTYGHYCFLTTNTYSQNASVSYATGCTRVTILANTETIDTAPSNARYLWVCTYTTVDRTPQKVEAYNKKSVSEILGNTDSVPTWNSENLVSSNSIYNFQPVSKETVSIDSSKLSVVPYGLHSNKTWQAKDTCVVIPCVYGDSFDLTVTKGTSGDGAWYGWLDSTYVEPTGNTTIPVLSGTSISWKQIPSGSTSASLSLTAPYGAAYLALDTKASKNYATWTGTAEMYTKLIDLINQKSSIKYVDDTKNTLRDEIELSTYSLTAFSDTWSTNDSSYISYTRDEDDIIVSVTTSYGMKRCGFSIADIAVGERLYVQFTSDVGIVFGVGETLSSTYVDVGTYKKPFYFTKTSSTQNYLYIPANSYSTGTTLRLVGFKVYKAKNMELLEKDVNTLKGYAFQPSSYIPIKESYETYMSVSGQQGSTIYNDFFVQGNDSAKITIYNLQTKTKIQDVTLPTFGNSRFHANTISFSGTKYDSGDDFPLLYICAGYVNTNNPTVSEVYVVRIVGESGSYTSELVQTINLAFSRWTEFVCDPVRNRAWINGSGIARYICIELPSISESEVTINKYSTIIDKFDTKTFLLGTTTNSSGQGRFFYHNRVYWVSGVPFYEGEGVEALYVVVDNVLTHATEAVVPLMNFGLTGEPEGCFIWNDDFYVAYRGSIVKLIQN